MVGLILPLIAYLLYGLRNKKKGVWTAWLLGAATFCVIHFFFRSPILSIYVMNTTALAENAYIIFCLVLVIIVGLLEAAARFAMARFMSRKELTYKRSIAAGMGYEGVEAIITLGIPYIVNLVLMQMINGGVFEDVIKAAAEEGSTLELTQMRDALISTGPTELYLVAYDSVITMVIHAALTLFVCHMVWRKKDVMAFWVSMAIYAGIDFLTMLIDGMAMPYLGSILSMKTSFVIKYLVLTIAAIAAVLYIILIHLCWKPEETEDETNLKKQN